MHTLVLDNTSLLACKNCYEIIACKDETTRPPKSPIPADWSFVQIGSTAEFNKTPLKVIGRIRLQLRNEYKNFWCAEAGLGKCLWIVESFGSFAVFEPTWEKYNDKANKLRSGISIVFKDNIRIIGEYVEMVEGVSYQGELGPVDDVRSWIIYGASQRLSGSHGNIFYPIRSKKTFNTSLVKRSLPRI